MAKNKKESKSDKKKSRVHRDLEGFEIKVNQHGEITSNYSIDKINEFLNKNVDDKKLVKRDAAEKAKREEEEFPVEEGEEVEETGEDFVRNATTAMPEEENEEEVLKPRKRKKGDEEEA